jgi:hypothetical protein
MTHGRDHQQREHHLRPTRTTNTPERDAWETWLLSAGRKRGAPPEGVIGAQSARRQPRPADEIGPEAVPEPTNGGSDVAPTARAQARELQRHAAERAVGRTAAGTKDRRRDERDPNLDRATLDRVARDADETAAALSASPPKR